MAARLFDFAPHPVGADAFIGPLFRFPPHHL